MTSLLMSRAMRSLSEAMKLDKVEGLAILTHLMYDETPLKLRLKDSSKNDSGVVATVKVFQGDLQVGFLVRDVGSGKVQLITIPVVLPLLPMDANTAEAMRLAIRLWFGTLKGLGEFGEHFDHTIDMAVSDRAASNLRMERFFSNESSSRLWLPCVIHQISTAQGRQLDLVKPDITGLVRLSLAMRPAGAIGRLKEVEPHSPVLHLGLACEASQTHCVHRGSASWFLSPSPRSVMCLALMHEDIAGIRKGVFQTMVFSARGVHSRARVASLANPRSRN
jgi:hypothetical protein